MKKNLPARFKSPPKSFLVAVVLFIIFYSLFFILPSSVLAGCPGPPPDSIPVIGIPFDGRKELLIGDWHRADSDAPKLSTLVDGKDRPSVLNLYQARDAPPTPIDLPVGWDFATVVGFDDEYQSILVPDSGYDIGQGMEVIVLNATGTSIVLKYGIEDDIACGYTLHLAGFNINENILAEYNRLNTERSSLPALKSGQIIGTGEGEILVAIRDTGTLMDPRWEQDWWRQNSAQGISSEPVEMPIVCECGETPTGIPTEPPPYPFPIGALKCTPSLGGKFDSRPYRGHPESPCDLCNLTYSYCSSCATSFTVHDQVEYTCKEGVLCEGEHWVEKDWGGTVVINPEFVTIPFVGKKYKDENVHEDEEKYLADYFEGTNEYYPIPYSQYWLEWVNHAGVFRKLTPMEYQNELKEDMVDRATKAVRRGNRAGGIIEPYFEGIHSYRIKYRARLCWDFPLITDAFIGFLQMLKNLPGPAKEALTRIAKYTHYCLYEGNFIEGQWIDTVKNAIIEFNNISPIKIQWYYNNGMGGKLTDFYISPTQNHFPPKSDDPDYVRKWKKWKESEEKRWYSLWVVMPMASREDTPGHISPYLGYRPKDNYEIINPEDQIEKVPHVARLFELTKKTQQMLFPFTSSTTTAQKKAEPILASSYEGFNYSSKLAENDNKKVLGEKTLLAQGPPDFPYGCKWYFADWTDPDGPCACMGRIKPDGEPECRGEHGKCCPLHGYWGICGWGDCQPEVRCPNPPLEGCPGAWIIGDHPGPAIPVCGLRDPIPVPECEPKAITDANPNDDLCCNPIYINLEATDQFVNNEYPCDMSCDCCVPPLTDDCLTPCACVETYIYEVSRRIGINLLHPYLTLIWNQTGKADKASLFNNGLLNIFRPDFKNLDQKYPKFREIDAFSFNAISYSYPGGTTPGTGKFYYNYLGGVQLAKKWLIRTLTPLEKK